MGQSHRIRVDPMGATHIQITLVDTGFLYSWSILTAHVHELLGIFFVKSEIRLRHKEIWAFAECHTNGFTSLDTTFLRRDGFCQHHAGSLLTISTNHYGDQTDIRFSIGNSPGSFPRQIRTIHIRMEHELTNGSHLLNLILLF